MRDWHCKESEVTAKRLPWMTPFTITTFLTFSMVERRGEERREMILFLSSDPGRYTDNNHIL